jgi:primase-polymerase (primpol)-like protein
VTTAPLTLDVLLDRIPEELRERDQWVGWNWAQRKGRWTKPPVEIATGGRAAVNAPATWCSFAQAAGAYLKGDIAGVGFVLTDDDPYTAIDLDKCRDPQTGTIAPWARDIITRLASYTEVSPSGTGIRIIVRGALPPGRRKDDARGIEMYDSDRYVTLTGRWVEVAS